MNNALWSPQGVRAGERNRATGYTCRNLLFCTIALAFIIRELCFTKGLDIGQGVSKLSTVAELRTFDGTLLVHAPLTYSPHTHAHITHGSS